MDVKTYLQIEHNTNGTQKISSVYAVDAQASDTYVITLTPAPTTYTDGMAIAFKANTLNTGAATINVNSLGAKSIVKNGGFALINGDIRAGQIVSCRYDGTNFVMQSPSRPFLEHQQNSNVVGGTITTSATTVCEITHSDVRVGDRIIVNATLFNLLSNTSTHNTILTVLKSAGTSAGYFYASRSQIQQTSFVVPAAGRFDITVSGTWTVTTAGTLTFRLNGQTTADTTTVDANTGQIDGLLLG